MDEITKEYRAAADAVRSATTEEHNAAEARYQLAKAAYDAMRAPLIRAEIAASRPASTGWWNLPIVASMWAADGADLNA